MFQHVRTSSVVFRKKRVAQGLTEVARRPGRKRKFDALVAAACDEEGKESEKELNMNEDEEGRPSTVGASPTDNEEGQTAETETENDEDEVIETPEKRVTRSRALAETTLNRRVTRGTATGGGVGNNTGGYMFGGGVRI